MKRTLASIVVGILVAAAALAFLRDKPDTYESHTSLYVFGNPSAEEAISSIGVPVFSTDSRDYVVSLLTSDEMSRQVIKTLNLAENADFWRHGGKMPHNLDSANRVLKLIVKVENPPRSPVVLRTQSQFPSLSKEITQTYLDLLKARLQAGVKHNEDFWDRHLHESRERIKTLDDRLQNFQTRHPMVMLQDKHAEGEFGFFIRLSEELALAQTNLRAVRRKLDAPAKAEDLLVLKAEKAGLEGRVANLLKLVGDKGESLKDLPGASVGYARLERDLEIEQKALETLTQSTQKSSLRGDIIPYEIVDEPVVPLEALERPIWKDALTALAVGLLAGWVLLQLLASRWRQVSP